MRRTIAFALFATSLVPCTAQETQVTRLNCDGAYNNYTDSDLRDISIKGILIEISIDKIRIQGSIAFDTDYLIISQLETGFGMVAQSNRAYSGFLNLFSGQLALNERGETAKDGTFKLRQSLSATCRKATPLF